MEDIEDAVEETLDCLQKKSPLTKQAICQALIDALEAEAKSSMGATEEMFHAMKLQ